MSEATRTVRIVTNDEALLASTRGAVAAIEGWEIGEPQSVEQLLEQGPQPGDVILLSPACASFDQYDSFEQRGRVFKELVKKLGRSRR